MSVWRQELGLAYGRTPAPNADAVKNLVKDELGEEWGRKEPTGGSGKDADTFLDTSPGGVLGKPGRLLVAVLISESYFSLLCQPLSLDLLAQPRHQLPGRNKHPKTSGPRSENRQGDCLVE